MKLSFLGKFKKLYYIIVSAVLLSLLIGCKSSKDNYNETTLEIGKKGHIRENIVESFGKEYYSLDELSAEFENEIEQYNDVIGGQEIKLDRIELKGDELFATVEFNGPSDYESFVGEELFVGSISDAYDNGYSMNVALKGVKEGKVIGKVQIMGMKDKNIIILSEPVRVKCFDDIAYVSANVDVINRNEARILSESGGLAYIVLK